MPSVEIVRFVKFDPFAVVPKYQTEGSAGADLTYCGKDITIPPGERYLATTGIGLELPKGTEGQIRSRSGLALKNGVHVLNSPGTIDSDYRGEVKVLLHNSSPVPFELLHGQRIAQLVISQYTVGVFREVQSIDSTGRGHGGFGSTGEK
jgi:dUTP pyrophosphatase